MPRNVAVIAMKLAATFALEDADGTRSIVTCGPDMTSGQVMRRRLVPSAMAVLNTLRELPDQGGSLRGGADRIRPGSATDRGRGAVHRVNTVEASTQGG